MASLPVEAQVSSRATEDGAVLVSVDGDVNAANAPVVGSRLLDVVGWPRSDVVVDLRGITWIDPGVLRTLMIALRQAEARKHTLILVRPNPNVWETFESAGLADALSNCSDLNAALGQLRDSAAPSSERSTSAHGGSNGQISPVDSPSLSARERRVLSELAHGRTTETAAAAIGISPHTVRSHLQSASRKLGAQTRAQAVALAIARGGIPVESI